MVNELENEQRRKDRETRAALIRSLLPAIDQLLDTWGARSVLDESAPLDATPFSSQEYDDNLLHIIEAFDVGPLSDPNYIETLANQGVGKPPYDVVALAPHADEELILGLLTFLFRAERFYTGAVGSAVRNGTLATLLYQLRKLYGM